MRRLQAVARSPVRINGGFFAFRREIFDYIREGEDLVFEPFDRLIARRQLLAYPYDGFWRNMDTFKDKAQLDELIDQGKAPWQVWLDGVGSGVGVGTPASQQPGGGVPGVESQLAGTQGEVLQQLQPGEAKAGALQSAPVVGPERAARAAGRRNGEA